MRLASTGRGSRAKMRLELTTTASSREQVSRWRAGALHTVDLQQPHVATTSGSTSLSPRPTASESGNSRHPSPGTPALVGLLFCSGPTGYSERGKLPRLPSRSGGRQVLPRRPARRTGAPALPASGACSAREAATPFGAPLAGRGPGFSFARRSPQSPPAGPASRARLPRRACLVVRCGRRRSQLLATPRPGHRETKRPRRPRS